jgi:hypothetical protein
VPRVGQALALSAMEFALYDAIKNLMGALMPVQPKTMRLSEYGVLGEFCPRPL